MFDEINQKKNIKEINFSNQISSLKDSQNLIEKKINFKNLRNLQQTRSIYEPQDLNRNTNNNHPSQSKNSILKNENGVNNYYFNYLPLK